MNQTLVNGLNILYFLSKSYRSYGVSELAEEFQLPKSHIHRLLQTLVENQYVDRSSSRRYTIGVGALRLGHSLLANIPLRQISLPILQECSKKIEYPLTLALPFNDTAISIAYVSHDGELKGVQETLGAVLSPFSSACGKVFMAFRSDDAIEEFVTSPTFTHRADQTYPTMASYREDLKITKKQGYNLNSKISGEVSSVALPILEGNKVIAALGASSQNRIIQQEQLINIISELEQIITLIQQQYHEH